MKVADVFSKLTTEPRPGLKKVDSEPGRGQRADDNVAGDRVDLSMRSREAGKMKEVLQATPDERLAMIESLKKEIGQGTYRVGFQACEQVVELVEVGRCFGGGLFVFINYSLIDLLAMDGDGGWRFYSQANLATAAVQDFNDNIIIDDNGFSGLPGKNEH